MNRLDEAIGKVLRGEAEALNRGPKPEERSRAFSALPRRDKARWTAACMAAGLLALYGAGLGLSLSSVAGRQGLATRISLAMPEDLEASFSAFIESQHEGW